MKYDSGFIVADCAGIFTELRLILYQLVTFYTRIAYYKPARISAVYLHCVVLCCVVLCCVLS